jgi:hypothetical protein
LTRTRVAAVTWLVMVLVALGSVSVASAQITTEPTDTVPADTDTAPLDTEPVDTVDPDTGSSDLANTGGEAVIVAAVGAGLLGGGFLMRRVGRGRRR